MTGTPGGSRGVVATATTAASRRRAARRRPPSAGATAAPGTPPARPRPARTCPGRRAARRRARRPAWLRFHTVKRLIAVAQNPVRAAGVGCAVATAVVSSMTRCAVSRPPPAADPQRLGEPQAVQGVAAAQQHRASGARDQVAAAGDHADQRELDAPVNASRLSAQACATPSPAATAAAPKASPDSPTASPTPSPSRTADGQRRIHATDPRNAPEPGRRAQGRLARNCARRARAQAMRPSRYAPGGTPTMRLKCRFRCAWSVKPARAATSRRA